MNLKYTTQFNNQENDSERYFSKGDTNVFNNHMKRCSTFLVIRELKNKITMSYHFTPNKMAFLVRKTNKCEDVEALETLICY